MNTEDLIHGLVNDGAPRRAKGVWRSLTTSALLAFVGAALLVGVFYGVRADWTTAQSAIWSKMLFCFALVIAVVPLAFRLARPNTNAREQFMWAAAPMLLSLAIASAVAFTVPADARMALWIGAGIPVCLYRIPFLALPGAIMLMWSVRARAPTRLTFAGAALGALAGGIAGIAYSWFCPMDSIAYVATWYLAAVLLCAALGAVAGRWLLRW